MNATDQLLWAGQGNMYGFYIENNTSSDIFLQLFNAASVSDVTVGTTAPDVTYRIPASGAFGKDSNDTSLHFFHKGCVFAVTTTRTGSTSPSSDAAGSFWFWNT
jgi:hypothetical protein